MSFDTALCYRGKMTISAIASMAHRFFCGKGDFFCFLDEDNWFDTNHVASLLDVIRSGFTWTFSFRKIVDREGNFICNDDCESLGKWPSFLDPFDYLIDNNCYRCRFKPGLVLPQPRNEYFAGGLGA